MDKHTLAGVMSRLGAAYGRNVEPDQLVVFYDALARYSNEAVVQAAAAWVESQERFPTPAQLISTTQSVLRRHAVARSETHGVTERSEQPKLTSDERMQLARSGIGDARAALAAGLSRRREQPEKEAEDA